MYLTRQYISYCVFFVLFSVFFYQKNKTIMYNQSESNKMFYFRVPIQTDFNFNLDQLKLYKQETEHVYKEL